MTEAILAVNGHPLTKVRLTVGNTGPWHAECDFEVAPELAGRVTLAIGALQLSGTIAPEQDGTFGLQRKCHIVAGAGGWSGELVPKGYHNDAGVKARNVAEDAAREVGETLGTFVPRAERIGVDYVRQVGPAARALEDVIGGAPWWVDYAGLTHVGPRPPVVLPESAYEVLAYDPRARVVTLAVDDPGAMQIGAVLSERLDVPQTVREFELSVTAEAIRVKAWCGGADDASGHLVGVLRALAARFGDGKLLGKYRYRVVRMAGQRVELQSVRRSVGLPDLLAVSMWPGVAGAHAELAAGAEVLVEFIEGDRTQPIVSHFAGADGAGFVPVSLTFCESTQRVARQGDLVQSGGPGAMIIIGAVGTGAPPNQAVVAGTPYPVSFSGLPTDVGPLAKPLYGAIATGSPKVKA